MTKIIGYTLMIFLSASGAALSAVWGGEMGIYRGFILGTALALSVVIGEHFISKKNHLAQGVLGIFFGVAAGTLIVLLKFKVPHRDFNINFNSEFMIILLATVYGGFFQWIVMSDTRKKALKLFLVSFVCIFVKLNYRNGLSDIGGIYLPSVFVAISALLFTILWYLPIWFFYTRKHSIISYIRCIPLNLRMLKLVFAKHWLSKQDYAESYDRVAVTYDDQWLCQLRPVTETLLDALAEIEDGDILDLGCGTGLSTLHLEKEYPENPLIAVDISPEMLNIAREKCSRSDFVEADILEFLQSRPDNSASLIFSGWAIGYSSPAEIIFEAKRVLKTGGTFAFVVNYSDTLAPVFNTFRKCMNKFYGQVNMALNPKFPNRAKNLLKPLRKNGFVTKIQKDGTIPIYSPEGEITLEWLLKTGVLAGFDQVMPLHDNPELIEYFNKTLRESKEAVKHHYFMGVFVKK